MQGLIIDDDPLICDLLEHFCGKIPEITSVTTTNSGFESVNLINGNSFDIIFLDYNLPDITGKDILSVIPASTPVIMITSNKDFAPDSYNYDQIVDFLVKPVDFARFFKSFQKAQQFLSSPEKEARLFIKDGTKLVKIDLRDVLYFKSEANYVSVAMSKKKILSLMTLKDLEKKLPGYFQRVHRSYIVNLNKVETIEPGALVIDAVEIPISDSYEKEFLKKINLLN